MKRTFLVYFEQVNQICIEVESDQPDLARFEAKQIWRRDHGQPSIKSVEEKEAGCSREDSR